MTDKRISFFHHISIIGIYSSFKLIFLKARKQAAIAIFYGLTPTKQLLNITPLKLNVSRSSMITLA
jgi:hypothetical protein